MCEKKPWWWLLCVCVYEGFCFIQIPLKYMKLGLIPRQISNSNSLDAG